VEISPDTSLRPGPDLLWGVAVVVWLGLATLAWEAAFSHTDWLLSRAIAVPPGRTSVVLWILTGFLVAAGDLSGRRAARDVRALGPATSLSGDQVDEIAKATRRLPVGQVAVALLVAVPIGVLVPTVESSSTPLLLSGASIDHDVLRALFLNAALFGLMGTVGVRTLVGLRQLGRLESSLRAFSLLDLRALQPFAQRGLRNAFVWLGGSAIAGLVYVDQEFATPTAVVLLATVGLGLAALLLPLRGVHRRIAAAKQAELDRIRSSIEAAGEQALKPPASQGRSPEPGGAGLADLLAYEARIASVREWPLDIPTVSRFTLLLLVAIGSWLGGAIVERLLGQLLD